MTSGAAVMLAVLGWMSAESYGQAGPLTALPGTPGYTAVAPVQQAILDRSISLDLRDVALATALEKIGALAHVDISFSTKDRFIAVRHVSVTGADLPLGVVLDRVLLGTGLDVRTVGRDAIVLTPRSTSSTSAPQGATARAGAIKGTVQDATTKGPLAAVSISLGGTARGATTDLAGLFRIVDVPAGHYRVTARRLGYRAETITVDVGDGDTAVVQFVLQPSPAMLDAVVTTIVGDQHLRELGNSIGTIRADSIVPVAPVTNVSDVISGRVAGVQVFTVGGLVGASPQVNIRGQNAYSGLNQPLLYVDGTRVDNGIAGADQNGRFNDLIPEEIESIEVIKGAAAATLYGTDAGNGVILVRTKRGQVGRPRWTVWGQEGLITADRSREKDSYYAWGRSTDGTNTIMACPLQFRAAGTCNLDSVTHFSPYDNTQTTPLGVGTLANYGVQLSGGNESIRYFASGTYDDEVGYMKMPIADVAVLAAQRGALGVSGDERHPNSETKYGARENLTASPNRQVELALSADVLKLRSDNPSVNPFALAVGGLGYRDSTDGWRYGVRPYRYYLNNISPEDVTHTSGGATATWRPSAWFSLRGDAGIDYSDNYQSRLTRAGEGYPPNGTGLEFNSRDDIWRYTYNANAAVTVNLWRDWSSSTAIGANYNHRIQNQNSASGANLAPGCSDISCAALNFGTETRSESKVAGAYFEQTISAGQRLFLKGGVRADAGSTFNDFAAAVYPKASVSWLPLDNLAPSQFPVSSLRLRAAYGTSGVQPDPSATISVESTGPALIGGQPSTGSSLPSFGNKQLRPQRQYEFEGGADVELWRGRVRLEFTAYTKRTSDQLILLPVPTSLGGYNELFNAGNVHNEGYEGLLTARVLDGRGVSWDWTLNASVNHSRLTTLGALGSSLQSAVFTPEIKVGYPVFSWFQDPVHWVDANHDGIPEPSEVTVDTVHQRFVGSSDPTIQATIGQTISLFNNRVSINAQLDYRGGFYEMDVSDITRCAAFACRGAIYASESKAALLQATIAQTYYSGTGSFVQNASFARLREVSITYRLPITIAHYLRGRDVSVTASGRNLFLWTRFKGIDPESGDGSLFGPTAGAYAEGSGVIPARYWLLRVNVGL